jgi:hypothetical protein
MFSSFSKTCRPWRQPTCSRCLLPSPLLQALQALAFLAIFFMVSS